MKRYIVFFILYFTKLWGFGQAIGIDLDATSLSIQTLRSEYSSRFKARTNLYNGPEYTNYTQTYFHKIGHQFFISDSPQRGTVYYNEQQFSDITLCYDVVLDQVVLLHPSTSFTPRLVNEHVRFFVIDGRRFVRLVADSATGKILHTGFYQLLVDSTVQVIAKRIKLFTERLEKGNKNIEFYSQDKFFLRKNNLYYSIDTKSSMTKHMIDHEKEILQFIKYNRLKFNKGSRETSIVRLAEYYNSLATKQ